jgi:hypothetical protein
VPDEPFASASDEGAPVRGLAGSAQMDRGRSCQIVLLELPRGRQQRRAFADLARLIEASLADAKALASRLPVALPRALAAAEAAMLLEKLAQGGFRVERAHYSNDCARCHTHVKHVGSNVCARCSVAVCTLCEAWAGGSLLCPACNQRQRRSRLFFRARVAFLLGVLAVVLARGAIDYVRRHERRTWQRPLEVALVLIERGSVDPAALAQFQERIAALEESLEAEFSRYGGAFRPIHFRQFGPVRSAPEPPRASREPSRLEPLYLAFELWRFARETDRAAGLARGRYDGKVYVLLSVPTSERQALVEGLGQEGGHIALTNLELSEDSVDFGLFVVAHELFHLLGATDRYDESGRTIIPDGLAEPAASPLYPQRGAEVMARGRVLAPGVEEPPGHLSQLRVGTQTAAEIGWLDPEQAHPVLEEANAPSP